MTIDQISEKIGELTASMKMLRSQTKDQWEDLGELKEALAELKAIKEDVAEMKPYVDDYRKLKQRGIGVLMIVGIMGSGLGAAAAWLIGLVNSGG